MSIEPWIVLPMVIVTEGVWTGLKGWVVFYPRAEIARTAALWVGTPITLNHPATDKLERNLVVGTVKRPVYRDGRLSAEAWLNARRLAELGVADRIREVRDGARMAVSCCARVRRVPRRGTHKGKPYQYVARIRRADHVAILPNDRGACDQSFLFNSLKPEGGHRVR